MKRKIRLSYYYGATDDMEKFTIENGKNSDTVNFVRNSLIAMRGPEFANENIDEIINIMENRKNPLSLREALNVYDVIHDRVHTVNPYAVMCTLCSLRSEDFAKAHAAEVTELLNDGCPSIEEALKIIDNADKRTEIRERMQAIYDHLDAINEIMQAVETIEETHNIIEDTGDFIDPADFI